MDGLGVKLNPSPSLAHVSPLDTALVLSYLTLAVLFSSIAQKALEPHGPGGQLDE